MNRPFPRTLKLCVVWNPSRNSVWIGSIGSPDHSLAALRGDGFTAIGWMSDAADEQYIASAERRALAVIAGRGARRVGAPGCFAIGPALLVSEACAIARDAYRTAADALSPGTTGSAPASRTPGFGVRRAVG